jgi:hypothetical protein
MVRRRECANGHKFNTEERAVVKTPKESKDEAEHLAHRAT